MAVDYITRLTFEDENQQLQEYDIHDKRVDSMKIPTKVSQLENDNNYIEDASYVHTDNNYNDIEKEKVATIENKVDKVEGKGLSTNDLTDELLELFSAGGASSHTHSNKQILDDIDVAYTQEKETKYDNAAAAIKSAQEAFGFDLEKPKMLFVNPADAAQKLNLDWENIQLSNLLNFANITPSAIQLRDTTGASTDIKKTGITVVGKTETPSISVSKLNSNLKLELLPGELKLTNIQGDTLTINANTGIGQAEAASKDGEGNVIIDTYATIISLNDINTNLNAEITSINNKVNSFNHNCFYRGNDITSYLTDGSLWDRVAGVGYEEFEDIYLGDYITLDAPVTAEGSTKTGSSKMIVAGFNLYRYIDGNHLVMLPDTDFGEGVLDAEGLGGYANTNLHTTLLNGETNSISAKLKEIFGDHLKSYSTNLVNTLGEDGLPAATAASTITLSLLNELEITGSRIWGANGYNIGNESIKLPIFNFISPFGSTYWLRDIIKSNNYCAASFFGEVTSKASSDTDNIKAKFILG